MEEEEDFRHFGPFNVDRAPTGQFVPKGTIRQRGKWTENSWSESKIKIVSAILRT